MQLDNSWRLDFLLTSLGHPDLNLNAEEKRVYGELLREADPDGFGAVSGDVAVKFLERTKLPADVLGQVRRDHDAIRYDWLTACRSGRLQTLKTEASSHLLGLVLSYD